MRAGKKSEKIPEKCSKITELKKQFCDETQREGCSDWVKASEKECVPVSLCQNSFNEASAYCLVQFNAAARQVYDEIAAKDTPASVGRCVKDSLRSYTRCATGAKVAGARNEMMRKELQEWVGSNRQQRRSRRNRRDRWSTGGYGRERRDRRGRKSSWGNKRGRRDSWGRKS